MHKHAERQAAMCGAMVSEIKKLLHILYVYIDIDSMYLKYTWKP